MACNGGYILIVDDDLAIRQSLLEIVGGDYGHNVKVAGDGCEALAVLSRSPAPALILLDLMMPSGMGGVEFIEHKTRQAALTAIPLCLMTASGPADGQIARIASVAARSFSVLRKPFEFEALMSIITRYC